MQLLKKLLSKKEAKINRKNIIIVGLTRSSKTAFLNSLLELIPLKERIIAIDDTKELKIPHENKVVLQNSKDYRKHLDFILKSRPQRLIIDEVTTSNIDIIDNLLASGHQGLIATIYANTVQETLNKFSDIAKNNIDIVYHIDNQAFIDSEYSGSLDIDSSQAVQWRLLSICSRKSYSKKGLNMKQLTFTIGKILRKSIIFIIIGLLIFSYFKTMNTQIHNQIITIDLLKEQNILLRTTVEELKTNKTHK